MDTNMLENCLALSIKDVPTPRLKYVHQRISYMWVPTSLYKNGHSSTVVVKLEALGITTVLNELWYGSAIEYYVALKKNTLITEQQGRILGTTSRQKHKLQKNTYSAVPFLRTQINVVKL